MTKENIKRHLISASLTFTATFAFFFFGLVANETFTFSKDAIYAAVIGGMLAGVRAVAKIIFEWASEFLSSGK